MMVIGGRCWSVGPGNEAPEDCSGHGGDEHGDGGSGQGLHDI